MKIWKNSFFALKFAYSTARLPNVNRTEIMTLFKHVSVWFCKKNYQ